jgi:hypothetical protein
LEVLKLSRSLRCRIFEIGTPGLDAARENGEGLMANETGKFDVPALGNLTPGIPNRRRFMLLGASAAAGMTVPASAFAQTERPTNPPDKPRGQVIAALSQEPTDRR